MRRGSVSLLTSTISGNKVSEVAVAPDNWCGRAMEGRHRVLTETAEMRRERACSSARARCASGEPRCLAIWPRAGPASELVFLVLGKELACLLAAGTSLSPGRVSK